MDPRNNHFGELNQFLYTKCYDQLCTSVSNALGRQVSAVIHQNQISVDVDEDNVWYVFRANVEFGPDETEKDRITVRFTFNGDAWALSVTDIIRKNSESPEKLQQYGVYADQHLIPRIFNDEQREAEAKRFLERYCPEALTDPMLVPIRSIMEKKMGLNVITNFRLPDNAYGEIAYRDDQTLVMNEDGDDLLIIPRKRGDVLIDGYNALLRGFGAMNFTRAHEAYHWFAHRAYVDFHRLTGKQADGSYNGTSRYSSADILEIQANAMASRILMPRQAFIRKAREMSGDDIHSTINSLASFFHVSYSAATIRLAQLGLYDFRTPVETTHVTPWDAFDVYLSDDAFRELVDTEQIVYTDEHYVYNRPEYVTLVWEDVPKYGCSGGPYQITDYALSHPEEAFVRFTIDHRRVIGHDGEILQARSDAYLRAQVNSTRRLLPEKAKKMKRFAKIFEQKYQSRGGKTFCETAKEIIEERYGSDEEVSPVKAFCGDTLQKRQYYEKIMKGTAGQPENNTLMSLCVGFCLSVEKAVELFRSAGRSLSWSRTDQAYCFILAHMRDQDIEDVNVFLDDLGISPLGTKQNKQ